MDIIIYNQIINITPKINPNKKELRSTHNYILSVALIGFSNIGEFVFVLHLLFDYI